MGMYSCANTGRISGGPKDVTPPVVDRALSTQDKQTSFYPQKLTFYFDEFVEVKDPIKQVIVSPPLTYIPSVKSRGKRVTFTFDEKEVLRDNATYTINFGEAIVDYHEGNKLQNFTFVFSTGDYLDSLSISGKIYNAKTGEPEPEMIVVLYDILQDSIVKKEKPFYFTRPDRNGNFSFTNIKSDTFKIFAIKDENLNYKYDLVTEKIAFLDSPIVLQEKSIDSILLRSSLPVPPLKLKTRNIRNYGKAVFQYNTNVPHNLNVMVNPPDVKYYLEIKDDSLGVYYDTALDSFFIYTGIDTFKIMPKGKNEWMSKSKLKAVSPMHKKRIHPSDSVLLTFNYPLDNIDFKLFKISDTLGFIDDVKFKLDNTSKNIVLEYPWELGEKYNIELDSGAFKSIYGHVNEKVSIDFSVLSLANSATMIIEIEDLDSTKNYAVHILKEKTPLYGYTFNHVTKGSIELTLLEPMKYNIEIIQDDNSNGQWDPGDYYEHRQPELNYLYKGDILKVNRENKINISWAKSLRSLLESRDAGKDNIINPFEKRK